MRAIIESIAEIGSLTMLTDTDSDTAGSNFLFQSTKESGIQISFDKFFSMANDFPHIFLLNPRQLYFLVCLLALKQTAFIS
jgi:hypothetical protein